MRILTWLNICTQVAFPLAVTFTPVVADANFINQPLKSNNSKSKEFIQNTQTYTLSPGEAFSSVAKKYNLTQIELCQLNPRCMVNETGYWHLQSGEEIIVPVAPISFVNLKEKPAAQIDRSIERDTQAVQVASITSQVGSFIANHGDRDSATDIALGKVSGEAGNKLQQWMSNFGTAQVQLNVDKDLSLQNSQLDLLVPIYDEAEQLVFTQFSLHRTDERTQSNLGFGFRHFTPTYMLGGNIFGDYDLSREHARLGIGFEYSRDYIKLAANSYLRLTRWKDSPDLLDYEERPANGWDVRAQGWLPSVPQLGAKLVFEQYYGKEVGLFGIDNRQRDPNALTLGVNYTPVPLLTLSAEQRQGHAGQNDSRFGIDMNYRVGVPLSQQVNPAGVAVMRTLENSHYNLVERNNNIVLEYRKKDLIQLHTKEQIAGYASELKSLGVSVVSKYGLHHIDWSAPSLLAAGGKIDKRGSDYNVILPVYNTTTPKMNTYTISGVAVDTHGNKSSPSETQVTVLESAYILNSTFSPSSSELPADGKSTQVLTLSVINGHHQAVDIPVADISLSTSRLKSAVVNPLVKVRAGVYEVKVTAGTDQETVTLTPNIGGMMLPAADVIISSSKASQINSFITTDKSTYKLSDFNNDRVTVTVTLKDEHNKTITGAKSLLTKDSVTVQNTATLPNDSWKDNGDGTYTNTFEAFTPGTNLHASLKLKNWSDEVSSSPYVINDVDSVKVSAITVNNIDPYDYAPSVGFPTTGFKGAAFNIKLSGNTSPTAYRWTADAPWVVVRDGQVVFEGVGNGQKVTITGTPYRGVGNVITYSFQLNSWFTARDNGDTETDWKSTETYCQSHGYQLPSISQLNGIVGEITQPGPDGEPYLSGKPYRHTLGSLWGEWGNLAAYANYHTDGHVAAVSTATPAYRQPIYNGEVYKESAHYTVNTSRIGVLFAWPDTSNNFKTICYQAL